MFPSSPIELFFFFLPQTVLFYEKLLIFVRLLFWSGKRKKKKSRMRSRSSETENPAPVQLELLLSLFCLQAESHRG